MTVRQKLSFDIFLDTLYARIFLYPLLLILRTYLSLDRYYCFVSLLTYTLLLYKIIPFLDFFLQIKNIFLTFLIAFFRPLPKRSPMLSVCREIFANLANAFAQTICAHAHTPANPKWTTIQSTGTTEEGGSRRRKSRAATAAKTAPWSTSCTGTTTRYRPITSC